MKMINSIFGLDSGDSVTVSTDSWGIEIQLTTYNEDKEIKAQIIISLTPDEIDHITRVMHEAKFLVRRNLPLNITTPRIEDGVEEPAS